MTASPNPAALRLWRNLTMRVLARMLENGASPEICLTHKGIGICLPRHALSAALKDLKDLGFVFFAKGLWGEDGEMAGAGHGLTAKGMKAAQIMLARKSNHLADTKDPAAKIDATIKACSDYFSRLREIGLLAEGPLTDDGGMIAGTIADLERKPS